MPAREEHGIIKEAMALKRYGLRLGRDLAESLMGLMHIDELGIKSDTPEQPTGKFFGGGGEGAELVCINKFLDQS